jgi:hypothetical protein
MPVITTPGVDPAHSPKSQLQLRVFCCAKVLEVLLNDGWTRAQVEYSFKPPVEDIETFEEFYEAFKSALSCLSGQWHEHSFLMDIQGLLRCSGGPETVLVQDGIKIGNPYRGKPVPPYDFRARWCLSAPSMCGFSGGYQMLFSTKRNFP